MTARTTPSVIDVARAAGVSKSTASRALSGNSEINARTRQRVLDAAEALGYRKNRMASSLRDGQSRLLGLIVTNLVNSSIQTITQVIQHKAQEHGYQVLLVVTDGDPKNEAQLVGTLFDHSIDGLIVMGSGVNAEKTNGYLRSGTPVVNLIRRPEGTEAPSILPDNVDGSYQATSYLIRLGHQRIAFIGGPDEVISGHERYLGYATAMAEAGIDIHPELVVRGPFSPEFGADAAARLVDGAVPFTATLVANHEAIFGALPEFVHRGIRIPRDLSLIGMEDVPWFPAWRPPITVVDIDPTRVGEEAFAEFLRQRDGEPASATVIRVPGRLVVRGSVREAQVGVAPQG